MDERESAKYSERGFTLIEVMIALVIFSMLIGLSGRFVAAGVNRPFIADRVEPWLQFIEDTRFAVQRLSPDSGLLTEATHIDPFPELEKPAVIANWKMEWIDTSLAGWQVARFTATTTFNKTIQWHVFYKKE